MNEIILTPKQELIINNLRPEDAEYLREIQEKYKLDMFTLYFPFDTVELAKQSFMRMFFLHEFDYDVKQIEELPLSIKVTFQFGK